MSIRSIVRLLTTVLGISLIGTACSNQSASDRSTDSKPCPSRLVIQTDWWPEVEHGGSYQLIGVGGTIDKKLFRYSGPIDPRYKVGGVESVEIRAGGDAISFTPIATEMKLKPEIMFGFLNATDAMKYSATNPVVAVAKTLDVNPMALYWDPTQTTINSPEDIKKSGKKILHFDNIAFWSWMVNEGYADESQGDASYGGSPKDFIATQGNIIQQGFVTNEVYKYQNVYGWKNGKPAPVAFATLHSWGFRDYPATLTVLKDRLEELRPCLKVLVPAMARAWIDYLDDPRPIADRLTQINDQYDTFWKTSHELNAAALDMIESQHMAENSPDGTYCTFDGDRIAELATIMKPVFGARGTTVSDDLTATFTNDFCTGAPGRGGDRG